MVLLCSPVQCYESVTIPDTDIGYLHERLQKVEHMTGADALNTIIELENYYIGVKNGLVGEPSEMVDIAWHAHILNTPMYFSFSQSRFGYYLHHIPYWTGANKDAETQAIVSSIDFQVPMHTKLKSLGLNSVNETIWTYKIAEFNNAFKRNNEL